MDSKGLLDVYGTRRGVQKLRIPTRVGTSVPRILVAQPWQDGQLPKHRTLAHGRKWMTLLCFTACKATIAHACSDHHLVRERKI